MPLTTDNFWFEELKRVKDLPVGDPEILTKYVGGKGQPNNTYLLVRRLPANPKVEPVGVFYFYKYDPEKGGSVWMCVDFIVGGANMRDATIELVDRMMLSGLVLDDGTVLFPKIENYFADLPVMENKIPKEIREAPVVNFGINHETRGSVIAALSASTFISGQMDNPIISTFEVSAIARDLRGPDDLSTVTLRWRRAQ